MAMTFDQVETLIQALLNTPEIDYKIGQKSYSSGQKIAQLRRYRQDLIDHPTAEIAFVNFDMNIDEFGDPTGETQD